jgi:hypothetical protein
MSIVDGESAGDPSPSARLRIGDRQLAIWLSLLTFATYAYFQAGGGWNQNSQFDLTRAIVEHHTFSIDGYANSGDVSIVGSHVYSNKSPALSWFAAIPYAILYASERGAGIDPTAIEAIEFNVYICTLICIALPGAFIAWMLYRYGRAKGFGAQWSALIAMTATLATQLLPYSTIFMLHVTSGALLLYALISPRDIPAGLAVGTATAMNYLCAPAIVIFALTRERKMRFLAGAIPPLILLAIYQKICFGSFFTPSLMKEHGRFLTKGATFGLFRFPPLDALFGISVSSYRGLFYFAPVLIMSIGGAILWFRERTDRRELAAVVLTFLTFFAINASFNGWDAGFGVGGRYLVPAIPLLALAMLHCRGWLRPMLVGLAAISFAINFAATAVDPQPSATIPRPLTQYILPLLVHGHFSPEVPITAPWSATTFTGHTSVNRMTFDEAIVFARHPPGSPPSEWASFNLGEPFFGAGDARSLIPIAVLLLLGGAAIAWKARDSGPANTEQQ